jgi:hypothetical protein
MTEEAWPETSTDGLVAEMHAAAAAFVAGVGRRVDRLVGDADATTLAAVLGEIERVRRGLEAVAVRVVGDVDRRGLYLDDGHRRPANWLRASVNVSGVEAAQRARLTRLCVAVPAVVDELAAGRLGLAHAAELARVHANVRVRDAVEACAGELVEWAEHDDHDTFTSRVREWERLVDVDGAHRDGADGHDRRRAAIHVVGEMTHVDGRFANLQGAALREVFDRFCDAEYHADVAEWKTRTRLDGVDPAASQLSRTPAQRRADALVAMCLAAAGAQLEAQPAGVVVNVVVDQATFEAALAELIDPLHLQRRSTDALLGTDELPDVPDGSAGPDRFCTTLDGATLDPVEVALHAIIGHVRRVVVGGDGVIIDLGRRQRLFRGRARDAAVLQGALDRRSRCLWPGCGRYHHCQIDHVTEWTGHGATDVANSATMCGHHNVFKSRGYTARRDTAGRWHLYRPDRSELVAV